MNSKELLKLIDKQWATRTDVQKIANVGQSKASKIFTIIYEKLKKENWYLQNTRLIPMSQLVDYLNIDIDYLKKIRK